MENHTFRGTQFKLQGPSLIAASALSRKVKLRFWQEDRPKCSFKKIYAVILSITFLWCSFCSPTGSLNETIPRVSKCWCSPTPNPMQPIRKISVSFHWKENVLEKLKHEVSMRILAQNLFGFRIRQFPVTIYLMNFWRFPNLWTAKCLMTSVLVYLKYLFRATLGIHRLPKKVLRLPPCFRDSTFEGLQDAQMTREKHHIHKIQEK